MGTVSLKARLKREETGNRAGFGTWNRRDRSGPHEKDIPLSHLRSIFAFEAMQSVSLCVVERSTHIKAIWHPLVPGKISSPIASPLRGNPLNSIACQAVNAGLEAYHACSVRAKAGCSRTRHRHQKRQESARSHF